jgi:hypothetical protein
MTGVDNGRWLPGSGAAHPDRWTLAGVEGGDERRVEEAATDEGGLDLNLGVLFHVGVEELGNGVDRPRLAVEPNFQF